MCSTLVFQQRKNDSSLQAVLVRILTLMSLTPGNGSTTFSTIFTSLAQQIKPMWMRDCLTPVTTAAAFATPRPRRCPPPVLDSPSPAAGAPPQALPTTEAPILLLFNASDICCVEHSAMSWSTYLKELN